MSKEINKLPWYYKTIFDCFQEREELLAKLKHVNSVIEKQLEKYRINDLTFVNNDKTICIRQKYYEYGDDLEVDIYIGDTFKETLYIDMENQNVEILKLLK